MSDMGWISIQRKIESHWLWEAKPFSYGQAWIDILLQCNHKDRKVLLKKKLVEAKRGQSVNSLKTWANRWGWSVQSVRTFLALLKDDNMINTESVGVTTRLTVLNYDAYQSAQQAPSTDSNTELTRSQHAPNTHLTTNNNDNNGNNGNNDVLRAHAAFRSINKNVSQHDLMRVTQLTFDYGVEDVVNAIEVCGDHGWHSVNTLIKVLKGDLPKQDKKQEFEFNKDALV